jgi:hypothetical protein
VAVSPGQHRVSESAGTGTNLGDYTASIGGSCAPDGSVMLKSGQSATCTITNVSKYENQRTAQVTLVKRCRPAGVTARFQLSIDQAIFQGMACGQSTGPVVVSTGDHAIGELAVGHRQDLFRTIISGDCSPNGHVILRAGQRATCTVTNVRFRLRHPSLRRPPPRVTG